MLLPFLLALGAQDVLFDRFGLPCSTTLAQDTPYEQCDDVCTGVDSCSLCRCRACAMCSKPEVNAPLAVKGGAHAKAAEHQMMEAALAAAANTAPAATVITTPIATPASATPTSTAPVTAVTPVAPSTTAAASRCSGPTAPSCESFCSPHKGQHCSSCRCAACPFCAAFEPHTASGQPVAIRHLDDCGWVESMRLRDPAKQQFCSGVTESRAQCELHVAVVPASITRSGFRRCLWISELDPAGKERKTCRPGIAFGCGRLDPPLPPPPRPPSPPSPPPPPPPSPPPLPPLQVPRKPSIVSVAGEAAAGSSPSSRAARVAVTPPLLAVGEVARPVTHLSVAVQQEGSTPSVQIVRITAPPPWPTSAALFGGLPCGVSFTAWAMACNSAGCSEQTNATFSTAPCVASAVLASAPGATGYAEIVAARFTGAGAASTSSNGAVCSPTQPDDSAFAACKAWCAESAADVHCAYCSCAACGFCSGRQKGAEVAAAAVAAAATTKVAPVAPVAPVLPTKSTPEQVGALTDCAVLVQAREQVSNRGGGCQVSNDDPARCDSTYLVTQAGGYSLCVYKKLPVSHGETDVWGCRAKPTECASRSSPPPPRPPLPPPPPPLPPPPPPRPPPPPPPPPARCADILSGRSSGRHHDPPLWCTSLSEAGRQECERYYVLVEESRSRHLCLWDPAKPEGRRCRMSHAVECA